MIEGIWVFVKWGRAVVLDQVWGILSQEENWICLTWNTSLLPYLGESRSITPRNSGTWPTGLRFWFTATCTKTGIIHKWCLHVPENNNSSFTTYRDLLWFTDRKREMWDTLAAINNYQLGMVETQPFYGDFWEGVLLALATYTQFILSILSQQKWTHNWYNRQVVCFPSTPVSRQCHWSLLVPRTIMRTRAESSAAHWDMGQHHGQKWWVCDMSSKFVGSPVPWPWPSSSYNWNEFVVYTVSFELVDVRIPFFFGVTYFGSPSPSPMKPVASQRSPFAGRIERRARPLRCKKRKGWILQWRSVK